MDYSEFVDVYESLASTTKKLEKATILALFLKKLEKKGKAEWVYLLKGKVVPDYDAREIGISRQLAIKAISKGFGVSENEIVTRLRKIGDLGEIAEEFADKRKQGVLFSGKLKTDKVFDNLRKIMEIEGKGAVDRKLGLVSELLGQATGKEAKYIVRTLLSDLRVGIADGIIRDGIAEAFFEFGEESEKKKEIIFKVEEAYDLTGDFAEVVEAAAEGKSALGKLKVHPGRPINVLLPVKVTEIEEAFRIVGKPAAIEHKYDGFRMIISKESNGEVKLFTRRLEEVTKQFPDVVSVVSKYVKGDSFLLDSEAVGFDSETKKYMPFQAISQRIKRKYDIEELAKKLPIELNIFDVLYLDGKNLMPLEFEKRRKIVEKIVSNRKLKIRVAMQIVTDSEKKAREFYEEALKMGEEGVMFKNLKASYRQGRRVGYIVKMKPEVKDLDLVIIGAEYGTGKRGGWLTSYYVACLNDGKYLGVGKVSSGLKEIESEEGTTYAEMTKILKPLIEETKGQYVKVKPSIVVSVTYQDVQKSPSYESGFALRFPRITAYRPEKPVKEITTLAEIKKES
ncbi:DNA ligase [Candidatus Pacearchaeota archaeon]|nr:DNA ligase [Candidatus Pacearchaeota archaeon]|tara:strand:- start:314 stop:2011 length:1698 start_codon:yes stop_codon:yes gene_type:complete